MASASTSSPAIEQVPQGLSPAAPVLCTSNDDVVLHNRYIETDGIGVELRGNCDVHIVNSHIVAGNIGILASANGDILIENSYIEGGNGALQVSGNGDVEYSGSTFRGGIRVTGRGEVVDLGGNDVDARGAGRTGYTTGTEQNPANVVLGPGGIRVQGADGTVVVGAGGVRAEDEHEGSVVVGPGGVRSQSGSGQVAVTPGRVTATSGGDTVVVEGGYVRVTGANRVTGNWRAGGRYSAADTSQILIDLGARETNGTIELNLAGDVLFEFDRADIRPAAAAELERVAHVLHHRATGEVIIEGHTDSVGDPGYNQTLSERRAVAVMNWLNANESIPVQLMKGRGLGSSSPIAHNTMPNGSDNPAGRAQNRRVEIRFAASRQ